MSKNFVWRHFAGQEEAELGGTELAAKVRNCINQLEQLLIDEREHFSIETGQLCRCRGKAIRKAMDDRRRKVRGSEDEC